MLRQQSVVALTASALALAGVSACTSSRSMTAGALSMESFDPWVGDWDGAGWAVLQHGQRVTIDVHEHVDRKVGGTVLVLEGKSITRDPDQRVLHDGLAIVYSADEGRLNRWRGHDIGREVIDVPLTPVDTGVCWTLDDEHTGSMVRFVIRVQGDRWLETGEVSRDGRNWMTIMECDLRRR